MSPFEQVEQIFHEALALPDGVDRGEWLKRRCGASASLRAEVWSLLAANDAASSEPAITRAQPAAAIPDELFGAYRPVRLLGRGGMSAVYLAERADGRFEKKVAVKVMAAHLAGDDFPQRFHTEGQFLAALHHPNITGLLDGGVSASGHPYLIVEHVEGEPLDRFCDRRQLGIEPRLRLFLQVSAAVDYAHRNLILHRDLKPANILVTADGVVKLLDFGTARLLSEGPGVTVTRCRMLTPRYASPEQLRGERPGVASDVFSLGVILYELLTGSWPFGDPDSLIGELRRATGDAAAQAPSSTVTREGSLLRSLQSDRLRRMLAGDLSAIAMKALECDAAKRYRTVAELAGDVVRFLEGRPVEARSPTYLYRAGKLLRRRWAVVTAAAVFILGLSVSTALALRQAQVAREEARKAQEEAQKSARVTSFLRGMLSAASRAGGNDVTVIQMLNAAEPGIAKSWKDDPLAEATLRASLGASYVTLMQEERANVQLERALTLFQSLGRHVDAADTLLVLGINAQGPEAQATASAEYYWRALEELSRSGKDAPPALLFRVKVYRAGSLYAFLHQVVEARRLLDDAIASAKGNPAIPQDLLAAALTHRGLTLVEDVRLEEADAMFRRALALNVTAFDAWTGLARSRLLRNDVAGALQFAHQEYDVASKWGVEDQAEAAMQWARYRAEAGEAPEAISQVRAALPMLREAYHGGPLMVYWLEEAARVADRAGSYREAEQWAHEALEILRKREVPEIHPLTAQSLEDLGVALSGLHQNGEAASAFRKAVDIYRRLEAAYAPSAERVQRLLELERAR